ncbi:MAG: hypothetical protein K6E38_05900 [Fretibacterium sp.]|nr:hypothetical protein [Fretibacterium sp.]
MSVVVPFATKYRTSSTLSGALQRKVLRAAEDTEPSFEELRDRIWGAASRQEGEESYWKTRSRKLRERLAREAEVFAERQRQRAIDQELYAQHLQQQQINERAALSEQGLEPGIIGLVSLVPPVVRGTSAPIFD